MVSRSAVYLYLIELVGAVNVRTSPVKGVVFLDRLIGIGGPAICPKFAVQ